MAASIPITETAILMFSERKYFISDLTMVNITHKIKNRSVGPVLI